MSTLSRSGVLVCFVQYDKQSPCCRRVTYFWGDLLHCTSLWCAPIDMISIFYLYQSMFTVLKLVERVWTLFLLWVHLLFWYLPITSWWLRPLLLTTNVRQGPLYQFFIFIISGYSLNPSRSLFVASRHSSSSPKLEQPWLPPGEWQTKVSCLDSSTPLSWALWLSRPSYHYN